MCLVFERFSFISVHLFLFSFVLTQYFLVTFSVTFFKAIGGAENIFEQLVDERLGDLEPMDTQHLVSLFNK